MAMFRCGGGGSVPFKRWLLFGASYGMQNIRASYENTEGSPAMAPVASSVTASDVATVSLSGNTLTITAKVDCIARISQEGQSNLVRQVAANGSFTIGTTDLGLFIQEA